MSLPIKYPLGIQTFAKIRENDYLYIDKTEIIYHLINAGEVYFFARPRRFGKSLIISTLEALFQGEKTLFEGLAIVNTDYDFISHPVIKIDFSMDEFNCAEDARSFINSKIDDIATVYGIELTKHSYTQKLSELTTKLQDTYKQKVVLLIDEYDKPILNNLNTQELEKIKQVLATFYATIKGLDKNLRFVFITGVSKFAKVSVFSGMNSLTDISMLNQYSTLCGITQQELENNFAAPLKTLSKSEQLPIDQMLAKIKKWYNGYRFHQNATSVYNPYSVLSLFHQKEFKNYWFSTGTPKFLLNLLQAQQYELKQLTERPVGANTFEAAEPQNVSIQSLFVQTGYLTIKDYQQPLYTLDFPNNEVRISFYDAVVTHYCQLPDGESQTYIHMLANAINQGDINDFFKLLRVFFANIPYDLTIDLEKYYHSIFFTVFTLLGFEIEAEVKTNNGRIDCVLKTADIIYIIEFKLNDTCQAALEQIIKKQYSQKYQKSGKTIILLGVEFNHSERNIGEFVQQNDTQKPN